MADDSAKITMEGDASGVTSAASQATSSLGDLSSFVEALNASSTRLADATDKAAKSIQEMGTKAEEAGQKVRKTHEEGNAIVGAFEEIGSHGRTLSIAFEALGFEGASAMARVTAGAEAMHGALSASLGPVLLVSAGLIAIGGSAIFLGNAAKQAGEWEQKMAVLGQTVRNQGGDWHKLSKEVSEWAELQERTTIYSRDDAVAALTRLTAAGMSLADAQKVVRVAEDAAAATHRGLTEVVTGLMQAEHGRTRSLTQLGIGTRESIKDGMAFNDVLKAIEKQMGGAAAAAADTYTGAHERLDHALETLQQHVGERLLPVLTQMTENMIHFVEYVDQHLPEIEQAFLPAINALKATASETWNLVKAGQSLIQFFTSAPGVILLVTAALIKLNVEAVAFGIVSFRDLATAVSLFSEAAGVRAIAAITTLRTTVVTSFAAMNAAMGPIGWILTAIGVAIAAFAYVWQQDMFNVRENTDQTTNDIIHQLGRWIEALDEWDRKLIDLISKIPGVGAAWTKAAKESDDAMDRIAKGMEKIKVNNSITPANGGVTAGGKKYTPEELDAIITAAAKAQGIDPALLKAVGGYESNLGASLDAQGKGDYGHGGGIWQLDNRSHSQADVDRAAKDPAYAAITAASMLKSALDKFGGDVDKALAYYNSGSGNPNHTTMRPDPRGGGGMLNYPAGVRTMLPGGETAGYDHNRNVADTNTGVTTQVGGKTDKQKEAEAERARHKEAEQNFHIERSLAEEIGIRKKADWQAEIAALENVRDHYATNALERQEIDKEITTVRARGEAFNAAEAKKNETALQKEQTKRYELASHWLQTERAEHKISTDEEIKGFQRILEQYTLTQEQKLAVRKRIATLEDQQAKEEGRLTKDQERQVNAVITAMERQLETERAFGGSHKALEDQLRMDIQLWSNWGAAGEFAAAKVELQLQALLKTDAETAIHRIENEAKVDIARISSADKLKSVKDREVLIVEEAELKKLKAQLASLDANDIANKAAIEAYQKAIDALTTKIVGEQRAITDAQQVELDKQEKAHEVFANKVVDQIDKLFEKGKNHFQGLADAFKDMLHQMEVALIKSVVMKLLFGGSASTNGMDLGTTVLSAFGFSGGGGGSTSTSSSNRSTSSITPTGNSAVGVAGAAAETRTAQGVANAADTYGILGAMVGTAGASQVISSLPANTSSSGGGGSSSSGSAGVSTIPGVDIPTGASLSTDYPSLIGSVGSDQASSGNGGLMGKLGPLIELAKSNPYVQAALIGAGMGAIAGNLMGGGSHTTWGMVGGALFGLPGAIVGSLFGHADNKANMPDKYDTSNYGQFVSNLNGASGTFNGQTIGPQSQYDRSQGNKDLAQQISGYIDSITGTQGMTKEQQDLIAYFKGLEGANHDLGVIASKNGTLTLGSGATVSYTEYAAKVAAYQSTFGAASAAMVPVYNSSHVFPDFANAMVTNAGNYVPGNPTTTTTSPNQKGTGGPPIQVVVQGTVVAEKDLAAYINKVVGEFMASKTTPANAY